MARRQLGVAPTELTHTATKSYADTGAATLQNKTISGASNTITNLPASATPDAARKVGTTSNSDAATANYWVKIASVVINDQYTTASLTLFVTWVGGFDSSARFNVSVYTDGYNQAPQINASVSTIGGSSGRSYFGGVKVTSSGATNASGQETTFDVWVKTTKTNFSQISVYEYARTVTNSTKATFTYTSNASWQSTEPTSTVSATASAITAGGNPVGVKVAVPSTATSPGVHGQWAADSSWYYVCTATDTWRRVAIASW